MSTFARPFDAGQVSDRGLMVGATAADTAHEREKRRLAVRAVAAMATSPEDCALLLDAFGLSASEGLTKGEAA